MSNNCDAEIRYADQTKQLCCYEPGHSGSHCWVKHKHAPDSEKEKVNHPQHYGGDVTYEAIKVIEAWGLGFHLGNAVKYICRADQKGTQLECLKKARWYLDRYIQQLEKGA